MCTIPMSLNMLLFYDDSCYLHTYIGGYECERQIHPRSIHSAQIKGLPEALKDPDSLVASNYSPDTVQKTFANMRRFRGGNAIFTFPPMPIKCPGAPQKIMYLADDYWRRVSLDHYIQMLDFY